MTDPPAIERGPKTGPEPTKLPPAIEPPISALGATMLPPPYPTALRPPTIFAAASLDGLYVSPPHGAHGLRIPFGMIRPGKQSATRAGPVGGMDEVAQPGKCWRPEGNCCSSLNGPGVVSIGMAGVS